MRSVADANIDRRHFVKASSAIGAAGMLGLPLYVRAEAPPEVSKIRLVDLPVTCFAPLYLAEEFLRMEGFSEIQYVQAGDEIGPAILGAGRADLAMWDVTSTIGQVDDEQPIVVLAGVHAGCFELFGHEQVRSIKNLKDRKIAVTSLRNGDHMLISSMLSYVGLNPTADVLWVPVGQGDTMELFAQRKVDAFIGFAPQPQELRRRGIGHVIVNTAEDRPWSQYFCCTVSANREFAKHNPVATKRALRAILKAADVCAQDPARVARFLVAKGYEPRYEIGLEIVKSLPYDRWRDANPEDTLRFHALRFREGGLIKNDPNQIIAKGSDWRFLNELRRELKA